MPSSDEIIAALVANQEKMAQQLAQSQMHLADAMEAINSLSVNRLLQTSTLDTGDTAWMIAATTLVLFMTVPGLGLYYAGITRPKNVLTTYIQCFTITCLITMLWLICGYSLAFGPAQPHKEGEHDPYARIQVIGDASRFWLHGLDLDSVHQLAGTIPESIFCVYQLTFAIITPALIVGSFADRMKYSTMIFFITLWHLLVYCPIAHSVWHPDGFLFKAGALDFAGGVVVHISSGISGLVSTLLLKPRIGFEKGKTFENYNLLLTGTGSAMLWVGWFGFNAGSAVAANDRACFALLTTQIATGVAAFMWMLTEWYVRRKPSVLGMVSGSIAGLVAITPACGFVNVTGAFFIGFFAGPFCYFSSQLKHVFGYDDCLDAFGVHAMGGMLGALLTGFFATHKITGASDGVFYGHPKAGLDHEGGEQLGNQIYAIIVCMAYAAFMTFVILKVLDLIMGIRVATDIEVVGLDVGIYNENVTEVERAKTMKEFGSDQWKHVNEAFSHLKTAEDINKLFDETDTDGGGYIDQVELEVCLIKHGIRVNELTIEAMFHSADNDNDGKITRREFVELIKSLSRMNERRLSYRDASSNVIGSPAKQQGDYEMVQKKDQL